MIFELSKSVEKVLVVLSFHLLLPSIEDPNSTPPKLVRSTVPTMYNACIPCISDCESMT